MVENNTIEVYTFVYTTGVSIIPNRSYLGKLSVKTLYLFKNICPAYSPTLCITIFKNRKPIPV
jgi:hypothetical protein